MVVFGTRPEIIRLSATIKRLDELCRPVLVHTGQNYDSALSDIFFDELGLRPPDVHLGIRESGFAVQLGEIVRKTGEVFVAEQPERVLILGDTNSALSALVAARMRIPVFHMEAGNRCYDDRVPEEINRRIIDHSSTVLMPYTHRSKENLLREGFDRTRIHVIGNPIHEVLSSHAPVIAASNILERLQLDKGGFFLVTLHRAENVDNPARLKEIVRGLSLVAESFALPMVVSVHPRTADRMASIGLSPSSRRVQLLPPLGFADFVKLQKFAFAVMSDSGTVQEESCLLRVPAVTLRDVTERGETLECGSNMLTGGTAEDILRAVRVVTGLPRDWTVPPEYLEASVSATVVKVLLGHDRAIAGVSHGL